MSYLILYKLKEAMPLRKNLTIKYDDIILKILSWENKAILTKLKLII